MAAQPYPHLLVKWTGDRTGDRIKTILKVPGVKMVSGDRLRVPYNAVPVVETLLGPGDIGQIHPLNMPGDRPTEAFIRERLAASGNVREFILEPGFIMPYQMDALIASYNFRGFSFWHPTGSGKTLTKILRTQLHPGPTIVVTRAASRLQYEFKGWRWATTLSAYVIRPESSLRVKDERLDDYLYRMEQEGQFPVLVCAWEALTGVVDTLRSKGLTRWQHVVFDEVHQGKSHKRWDVSPLPELPDDIEEAARVSLAQEQKAKRLGGFVKENDKTQERTMILPANNRTRAALDLARMGQFRTCGTATPVKDRVRDLFGQLDLAEPGAWGSATDWLNRYADRKPNPYGGYDTSGSSNLDELVTRTSMVVHQVDSSVATASLPPKRRESYYVPPDRQDKPLGGWVRQMKKAFKRGPSALMEAKLAQAASKKRTATLDLIGDHLRSKHKIVVFTGRRADVEYLGKRVGTLCKKFEGAHVWAAHGGSTASERQEVVNEYMDHPGPCVLVGTGDAFGEALDLQDTDAAMFVMLPWTPGQLRQWEGRFVRLGQKRPVIIYYIICEDTVDEHVASRLIEKIPAVEKLAPDTSLDGASETLGGIEDEDAVIDGILDALGIDLEEE